MLNLQVRYLMCQYSENSKFANKEIEVNGACVMLVLGHDFLSCGRWSVVLQERRASWSGGKAP